MARALLTAGLILPLWALAGGAAAEPATIVAIGGSNTVGWGVGTHEAYPTKLEALLKDSGYDARVINAGVSFSTTSGMLRRVDSAVPSGTALVILQPGGNDVRFFGSKERRDKNIATIVERMQDRNIKVIVFENDVVPAAYRRWDGIHFTVKGHDWLAAWLLPLVVASLTSQDPASNPTAPNPAAASNPTTSNPTATSTGSARSH
jgi:acyl-CoA thioesterase-1